MRPDSLLRLWRYINRLLTYLFTYLQRLLQQQQQHQQQLLLPLLLLLQLYTGVAAVQRGYGCGVDKLCHNDVE